MGIFSAEEKMAVSSVDSWWNGSTRMRKRVLLLENLKS
jgi:hypothetical protein